MEQTQPDKATDSSIYTEKRQRRSGGSGGSGFLIFLLLLLFLAIAGSGWLYFDQVTKNVKLRQEVIDMKQSLSIIREALQITDETITGAGKERDQVAKTLQEEVNKLWVLVNKKQKAQIKVLTSRTAENAKAIQKSDRSTDVLIQNTLRIEQNNDEKLQGIAETLVALETAINEIPLPEMEPLLLSIDTNTKNITALNSSRSALNSRVATLQQEISLLKNKILTLENNQPIPSHDLEKPGQ